MNIGEYALVYAAHEQSSKSTRKYLTQTGGYDRSRKRSFAIERHHSDWNLWATHRRSDYRNRNIIEFENRNFLTARRRRTN